MFSNPMHHESINPSIREVNLNRSSAAKYTSTFDIRRRPLPTNASSGDSVGAGNCEPLLKELQNVNVEEVFHLPQTSLAHKFKEIRKRLGMPSMATLAMGTIVILTALRFFSFLWLNDVKNKTWQTIAYKAWMTRAVSLTALAFRTAISMQTVILTSMLADLALERTSVPTMHLATFSAMRNINDGPFYLAWLTCKALMKMDRPWKRMFLPSTLILFLSTYSFSTYLNGSAFKPIPQSRTRPSNFDDFF
jgi:hypothetical protein